MTAMNWLSMAAQSVSELPPPSWINSTELFVTDSPCDTCSHINTHLNNMRLSPLLVWFCPSVLFFFLSPSDFPSSGRFSSSACGRAAPHVDETCACLWTYAYRWIWRGNVMPDQHLTPDVSFTAYPYFRPLFSSSWVRPPPHPTPQLIFFSSVKMKMRFISHVGRIWWVVHVACNSANRPAVRGVLSYNSAGWGLCLFLGVAHRKTIPHLNISIII